MKKNSKVKINISTILLLFSPLLQEDKDKLAEVVANITKELNWNETTQPFISVDGTAQVSKGYSQKRPWLAPTNARGTGGVFNIKSDLSIIMNMNIMWNHTLACCISSIIGLL